MYVIFNKKMAENGYLEIMDVTGKKLYTQNLYTGNVYYSVNTSKIDNGVYIYRIITNSGKVLKFDKLVIIK